MSVIVPVKDGLDLLAGCVRALLDQDYPDGRFEVIVADNGSVRSPADVLPADPRLSLIEELRPGSYAARNAALTEARGEILAFTDADCLPDRGWLRAASNFLRDHPDVAMIGGRVELRYRNGEPRNGPEWYEFVQGFPQERYLSSGFAVTANMVTRRATFDQVGVFDSSLMSGGDGEWGRRVRAAGLGQRYVPEAVVAHPARDTWGEVRIKTVRTTRGVVRRDGQGWRSRLSLLRLLAAQLVRTVARPLMVLRLDGLPTLRVRRTLLFTQWKVDAVVAGTLIKGLICPR